jgi:hypothetical protein
VGARNCHLSSPVTWVGNIGSANAYVTVDFLFAGPTRGFFDGGPAVLAFQHKRHFWIKVGKWGLSVDYFEAFSLQELVDVFLMLQSFS